MKFLLMTTLVASLVAGPVAAVSAHEYKRFGVDPDQLTRSQLLLIDNAISSNRSHNEIQAIINGILKGSIQRG